MLAVAPSGAVIDTSVLDLSEVVLEDVAVTLAHLTRWHGLTGSYSVGQHSVIMAGLAKSDEVAAACLLHDAAEGLCYGDIPSPLRTASYSNGEARLTRAIFERFDLDWPMPPEVKILDKRMAVTEAKQLLPPGAWKMLQLPDVKPLRVNIEPWTASRAKHEWRATALKLGLT